MNTLKWIAAALVCSLTVAAGATVPGFKRAHPTFEEGKANLLVNFVEEGLDGLQRVDLHASAHAVVVFQTLSGRQTLQSDLSGSVLLHPLKDGSAVGTILLAPPEGPAGSKLLAISYSHIELEDRTNGLPADISEELSRTFSGDTLRVWHKQRKHTRRSL